MSFRLFMLALAIASLPVFAQELHSTQGTFTSDNKPIAIERFEATGKALHSAVLLVHGGGGPDDGWRKSGILDALTGAGYTVFMPHYFDGAGKWSPSINVRTLFGYIRTLNDATHYVSGQPEILKPGIGLVGFSLGGYVVLGFAEEVGSHPPPASPKISAVIEEYGAMPDFALERLTIMPPVLILHGEEDELVPVKKARGLAKLFDKRSVSYGMKIYPGQGHGFTGQALADSNQRTVTFLNAHMH